MCSILRYIWQQKNKKFEDGRLAAVWREIKVCGSPYTSCRETAIRYLVISCPGIELEKKDLYGKHAATFY